MCRDDVQEAVELWKNTPGIGLAEGDDVVGITRLIEASPGCSFVAVTADGQIVGTCLAGHDTRRATLYHVTVDVGFRRRGIARRLVESSVAAIALAGIPKVNIFILSDNAEGESFWKAAGFADRSDLHYMQRKLSSVSPVPQTLESRDLLTFDPLSEVIVDPMKLEKRNSRMPEACVLCFFHEAIAKRAAGAEVIDTRQNESGKQEIFRIETPRGPVALMHPGVGAPLAAGHLEELVGLGAKRFVTCGGAGTLIPEFERGRVVIPNRAIRDEGTSYHYMPKHRQAVPSSRAFGAVAATLTEAKVRFEVGATWTTDAFYRETRTRMKQRRSEGALVVEMEAATFFAVAEYRGVDLATMLYCGDMVGGDGEWDPRQGPEAKPVRSRLLDLAIEAATHPSWTEPAKH